MVGASVFSSDWYFLWSAVSFLQVKRAQPVGEHAPLTKTFAADVENVTPLLVFIQMAPEELGARELPLIANIVFGALRGKTTRAVRATFQASIG